MMPRLKKILKKTLSILKRTLKIVLITLGIITTVMIILSFTDQPFWAYYWLGTHSSELTGEPEYIVVMGAGGMPSPQGLMRCYYAAEAAERFPDAVVVIALPTLREYFYVSHPYKMFKEIARRGIDTTRFIFEINGTNTYEQAREISKMINRKDTTELLIVTSPDHMMRSVLTFRKFGFREVGGIPSFEDALDEDFLLTEREREQKIKSPDRNVTLRYNMWNYLKYEIAIIREMFALGYYKVRGWI